MSLIPRRSNVCADERDANKHDAAAQVYIIFDSQYIPRVIKYIWSGALPAGARFKNPLYRGGRVVVLRNGPATDAQWYDEEVNFYDDYCKLFSQEPGKAHGIGLLTSSDSTKSLSIADYDDFVTFTLRRGKNRRRQGREGLRATGVP
jgi:hypothetical protein